MAMGILLCITGTMSAQQQTSETGYAAYYSASLHEEETASGEMYDRREYTCAHPTYPFGTLLRVTRLDNQQSVVVRVNDRGPFKKGYVVDLSLIAAHKIDLVLDGKVQVRVTPIGYSDTNPQPDPTAFTARGTPNSYRNDAYDDLPIPLFEGDPNEIRVLRKGIGGYAIQIGAYRDRGNAERQIVGLQEQKVSHLFLLEDFDDNGLPVYRIVIAQFQERTRAQRYVDLLRDRFLVNGIIIRL